VEQIAETQVADASVAGLVYQFNFWSRHWKPNHYQISGETRLHELFTPSRTVLIPAASISVAMQSIQGPEEAEQSVAV
jgi:hypothetical protein